MRAALYFLTVPLTYEVPIPIFGTGFVPPCGLSAYGCVEVRLRRYADVATAIRTDRIPHVVSTTVYSGCSQVGVVQEKGNEN